MPMIYNWHNRIAEQARGVLPCGGWDGHDATNEPTKKESTATDNILLLYRIL